MSSYDFIDPAGMEWTERMLTDKERKRLKKQAERQETIREERPISYQAQGCGYSECFYFTCPAHFPDYLERINNLINFYFREYGYIEVVENLHLAWKYAFHGQKYERVTLTFFR